MEEVLFELFANEIYKDCYQVAFQKPVKRVQDEHYESLNQCIRTYHSAYKRVAASFAKHLTDQASRQKQS